MAIKTKYKIGQDVYIVFLESSIVHVFRDTIKSILMTKDGLIYYVGDECEEFTEEDIIPIDRSKLLTRINCLLNKNANK